FLYMFISFDLTLVFPWLQLNFWQATADTVVRSPTEVDSRWLKKTVYVLATRANISVPRVELLDDEVLPRARAYAFWPQAGVIQISVAALNQWNHKTLHGVLAHEIAHLAHKDSWRSLWRVSTMIFFLSFTVLLAPQLVYFVL